MKKISILVIIVATFAFAAGVMSAEKAALPKYSKWEKSSRKVETDKNSLFYGIHYIYADKKAMKGYKSGGPYAEGSMFVVENFNIKEVNGKPVEGKKSMVVLMKKDRKYKNTGGWLFAGFTPSGKPSGIDPVKNCYECHLKEAAKTDLVISKYSNFR